MRNRRVKSVKDELVKKSREAMLAAVQIYNNPQITFKAEAFITLAVIAWTYLMHSYYRYKDIDYKYYEMKGTRKKYHKTKNGATKYWELERCINTDLCPLDAATKNNLRFLIGIRHEIEHQMTNSIDEFLSAKLQACAMNYDFYLKELFGSRYSVSKELALSIQFSAVTPDQEETLLDNQRLSENIRNFIASFEDELSNEDVKNPRYAYRLLYVPINANRKGQADKVIEFVKPDSPLAEGLEKQYTLIKETEKPKFTPGKIVALMHDEGYPKFTMHQHTDLWKENDAKNPDKHYGIQIVNTWYWYESWVAIVRGHCHKNAERYKIHIVRR